MVFPAVLVLCGNADIYDSQLVDSRPIEVLDHAYKHGYPDLADKAAYSSLAQPLKDICRGLTHPGLLAKWVGDHELSWYWAKH